MKTMKRFTAEPPQIVFDNMVQSMEKILLEKWN
jgi:hypothetical protein